MAPSDPSNWSEDPRACLPNTHIHHGVVSARLVKNSAGRSLSISSLSPELQLPVSREDLSAAMSGTISYNRRLAVDHFKAHKLPVHHSDCRQALEI